MNILAELRVHNFYCSDTPAGIKDVRVELQKVVKLQTVKMYWIIFFLKVKIVQSVSPFREKVPVSQVLVFWYCLVFCHFLLLHTCYNYIQQAAGLQHLGPSLLRPLLPCPPATNHTVCLSTCYYEGGGGIINLYRDLIYTFPFKMIATVHFMIDGDFFCLEF